MEIISKKKKVKDALERSKKARDCDKVLLTEVWKEEIYEHYGEKGIKAFNLIHDLIITEKLSKPESLTRARRKLQEQEPQLRGKLWNERHHLEAYVVGQLQMF